MLQKGNTQMPQMPRQQPQRPMTKSEESQMKARFIRNKLHIPWIIFCTVACIIQYQLHKTEALSLFLGWIWVLIYFAVYHVLGVLICEIGLDVYKLYKKIRGR